jgi:chloride channel protein, CIC family
LPPRRPQRRFHSPQANIPGQGILAGYSASFWVSVIAIGAATGFAGAGFIALLDLVERVAWRRSASRFYAAVTGASPERLVLVLLTAGAIAGAGTFMLARRRGSGGGEVSESMWLRGARMELLPSLVRGVVSILTVGMGASLGREGAPQLAGAAFASELCERTGSFTQRERRLLVAAGAGAGMAAVYNVPFGGALYALEVLLGTLALPLVLPALLMSLVATVAAWIVIPIAPTYALPSFGVSAALVVWAAVAGPLAGLAAVLWVRLIAAASRARPRRHVTRLLAPVAVFAALGALAIAYPQLLGNGKELAQVVFVGRLSVGLIAALLVLKPLVTASCLGSGAPGGLFTPSLAFGVLFGALLGHAWSELWPGSPVGSYAMIGGGAVLAASMQGPLSATVLMLELTHSSGTLTVPLLLAVVLATVVARLVGSPSIYSARLVHDEEPAPPPPEPLAAQAVDGP